MPVYARWILGVVVVLSIAVAYVMHSVGFFATSPIFVTQQGALDGFDPVEYFVSARAVRGSEELTAQWGGATWRFANRSNKDAFLADPRKYVPAYGGYCAYAMANNYVANSDPEAFTVVGDRLFLNFDMETRAGWLADRSVMVQASDRNWPASRPGKHEQ